MLDINQWITEGQVILVDKPLQWTSFDVVNKLKHPLKRLNPKVKIGHAGTLDPLATGLLIICIGPKTKTIDQIQNLPKTYIAEIFIGATRPSYDRETPIESTHPIDHITATHIHQSLLSMVGEQLQMPPIYSAIKQQGKPVYLKARKGKEVILTPKPINIYSIDQIDIDPPLVRCRIHCSKGTYIRSIAHDLGQMLGCGAYLHSLIRTQIGQYELQQAHSIDELSQMIREASPPNSPK